MREEDERENHKPLALSASLVGSLVRIMYLFKVIKLLDVYVAYRLNRVVAITISWSLSV